MTAAKSDFSGYEVLKRDIKGCEKYGTDSKSADNICGRIADLFADICATFNSGNTRYLPSLHTLDANAAYGMRLYTTLDARMRGEPVNKNAGAYQRRAQKASRRVWSSPRLR